MYPHTDKRPLVELKNGKLIFRQKLFSLEKSSEAMQEIVQFREMLQTRATQDAPPLENFPEEYTPLVAKLVHESEKTLQALTKHVHSQLLPSDIDEEGEGTSITNQLPLCCLESAINHIAMRVNYGAESVPNQAKVPAHLSIWRWEVDEQNFHWLPRTVRDKLKNRLYERRRVKDEVIALLGTPPVPDSTGALRTEKDVHLTDEQEDLESPLAAPATLESVDMAGNKKHSKPNVKLQPKGTKLDKELRERESRTRSQNLMANFLTKSKGRPSIPSAKNKDPTESTDFDRVFKPFALRKGVEVARINFFGSRDGVEGNPIVVSGSGGSLQPPPALVLTSAAVGATDRLLNAISMLPRGCPSGYWTRHKDPRDSVRTILDDLIEAEVAGDISSTRSLLSLLEDRNVIPAKIFIFHEDTRPGYFGTWTRTSSVIGPRRPFSRDVIAVDYSYDSSEEWEDENPNDADDVTDGSNSDDELDAEEDSDVDGWLVEDNNGDVEPVAPVEEVDAISHPKRRLQGARSADSPYKKRRVIPLVPFVKGPTWDPAINRTTEEVFTSLRVRFFNDNPCPVDPFAYVSVPEMTTHAVPNRAFLVPPIPEYVRSTSNEPQAGTLAVTKKSPLGPKYPFPEMLIPILIAKIDELATGSIVLIVETLHQELRNHKVKKNSIEAKVRELAVKKGRVWVAKQDTHSDGSVQPAKT